MPQQLLQRRLLRQFGDVLTVGFASRQADQVVTVQRQQLVAEQIDHRLAVVAPLVTQLRFGQQIRRRPRDLERQAVDPVGFDLGGNLFRLVHRRGAPFFAQHQAAGQQHDQADQQYAQPDPDQPAQRDPQGVEQVFEPREIPRFRGFRLPHRAAVLDRFARRPDVDPPQTVLPRIVPRVLGPRGQRLAARLDRRDGFQAAGSRRPSQRDRSDHQPVGKRSELEKNHELPHSKR